MIRRALLLSALTACSAFGSSSSSTSSGGETHPPPAPADAAADAQKGPTSTKVACGQTSCTAPEVCCEHQDNNTACVDVNNCRASGDIIYDCYDDSFCAEGRVCCIQMQTADYVAAVTCQPSCNAADFHSCTPSTSPTCNCQPFDTVKPANNANQQLFVCQ